jgi:Ca2+-binding EF-hand superfamily protein
MQTTRWLWVVPLLAGAAAVSAQPSQRPGREQLAAVRAEAFAAADADASGTLSVDEMEAFEDAMRERIRRVIFDRADTNDDGQLTLAELEAMRPPRHRGLPPDPGA